MCVVVLYTGDYRHVLEIKAPAMHTDQDEAWLIDITEYIDKHPKFRQDNNLVQVVNPNMCRFVK